jgi:putative transposase
MARLSRAVATDYPHHITQRGNYKQTTFNDDEDFTAYLEWLDKYSKKYSLSIWAYCLMNNHIHILGVPAKDNSLAMTFKNLHMRYSQYFNKKIGIKGHLWQGRFYSACLDENHVYAAVSYIENNPVRARIVKNAVEYNWSSAKSHVLKSKDPLLSEDFYLTTEISDWEEYLKQPQKNNLLNQIKINTQSGRPCGSDDFIQIIENKLKRKLKANPLGRPKLKED